MLFMICITGCGKTDKEKVMESAIDYGDQVNWAYAGIGEGKEADVFLICPTVDVKDEWNMSLSDEETKLLTDIEDPEGAAKALLARGIKLVAVTLGKDGAYVCTGEGGAVVPGFESKVVDTTGAGDSFWGGFLYQLAKSGKRPEEVTLEEAKTFARFGNAVASLCVEKRGGIPAMPTMEQVMERLSE